jgi:hypothetical protein
MCHCKMCGQESKLIRAHIIPEAFFRELRKDSQPPLLVSGVPGAFPKRAPIGVYDEEILCDACEQKFAQVDDVGINFFLKQRLTHATALTKNGQTVGYEVPDVNTDALLRFLVSVLWRASVSSQGFFSRVALGPFDNLARSAIELPTSKVTPEFDAVLSIWKIEKDLPIKPLLDPHRERWTGVNAYRIYFGDIVAYVKVDKRPFSEPLRACALSNGAPLRIVERTLNKSNDAVALRHTARISSLNSSTCGRLRRKTS